MATKKNNNYHHHTQKIFGYRYEVRHSEGMQLFCTGYRRNDVFNRRNFHRLRGKHHQSDCKTFRTYRHRHSRLRLYPRQKNGVARNLLDRACRICARLRIRRDGRLNQVSKNVEIFRKRRQSLRLSVFFLYKIRKTGYNKRVQR